MARHTYGSTDCSQSVCRSVVYRNFLKEREAACKILKWIRLGSRTKPSIFQAITGFRIGRTEFWIGITGFLVTITGFWIEIRHFDRNRVCSLSSDIER